MSGAIFVPGETKEQPGVYVHIVNAGAPAAGVVPQGTVATLFRASWGPLGLGQAFEGGEDALTGLYGTGGTTNVVKHAFAGRAKTLLPVRLGTGGTKGSTVLSDTNATPANVVTITARYEGARTLSITVRDSLEDTSKRELQVLENTSTLQTIAFAKGAGEPQALVDAVAASNSRYITATKLGDGNGTVKTVTQQALTGGTDPAVTGADYSTALALLDNQEWNVLAVDSEDSAVHTSVAAYITRVRSEGKRVLAVVGEPTSVAFDTRATNAVAFNNHAVIYVGNGATIAGVSVEGAKAAAWVAGRIAASAVTASLTHEVTEGATSVVGSLTGPQVKKGLNSGMLLFTLSARRQVHINKGINTLVTPSGNQDAGWKKIRRTRTRDNLIDRITATWDPLLGKVNNSPDGRATLVQAAQARINDMVSEGALLGGAITEDPANPPSGDAAYFRVTVDDLDSAETLYATFGFRFSS